MPKSQRLIQLMMMVNAKRSFTVQELADELGLSGRTIRRDLRELSELGVPVYSVQGRGGGYKLLRERLLPPIAFSESEAVAIYFACQSLQYFGSLPFDEGAESALHKFYHYLPSDTKGQIDRLKDRVAIWSPHRYMVTECLRTLLQAIMVRSVATIEYFSGQGMTKRDIQPVGLYASAGYWYCPAYCLLRGEFRLFRADRIRSAVLNESASCREEVWQHDLRHPPISAENGDEIKLTVELTPNGVRLLESDVWFGPSIERSTSGGGSATIHIASANLRFYADLVWRLGEDARIVAPNEAIEYIRRKIEAMRSRYGG